MEELYKIHEVARMLRLSIPTIRKHIKNGKIEAIDVSPPTNQRKTKRITKSAIEAYLGRPLA